MNILFLFCVLLYIIMEKQQHWHSVTSPFHDFCCHHPKLPFAQGDFFPSFCYSPPSDRERWEYTEVPTVTEGCYARSKS